MSKRSASTPPHAPKISIGRNCSAVTRPSAVPLLCGELEHQQRLRELLHPGAAHRDRLPDEVQAVVAIVQRREGVAPEAADAGHRGSSVSRSSSTAARASTARSSAVKRAQALREVRVALTANGFDERAAVVGRRDPRDAAILVALGAGCVAVADEHVDDARDRRRLHPLGLGEPRERDRGPRRRSWRAPRAATGVMPPGACWRSRRLSRMTARRSREATSGSGASTRGRGSGAAVFGTPYSLA